VSPPFRVQAEYLKCGRHGCFAKAILFDRFSRQLWLPIAEPVSVGVLVGSVSSEEEPSVAELELIFWGSAFKTRGEALEARRFLRGDD